MKNAHNIHSNEPVSAATHFVGALLSVAALVLMVVFAAIRGGAGAVVGAAIFGSALILLYTASSTYHFFSKKHPVKPLLQKLDHIMIYILIAGTYTPLCLVLPARGWGWSLFGVVWGLALMGILIKALRLAIPTWIMVIHFLLMGWLALIALGPIVQLLPKASIFWLFIGGAAYTIGVVFFALEKRFKRTSWIGMHEIFHVFVLFGSFAHFWMVLRYLTYI